MESSEIVFIFLPALSQDRYFYLARQPTVKLNLNLIETCNQQILLVLGIART